MEKNESAMSLKVKATVGLALLLSTLLHAADQLVRFQPAQESRVRIEGTGTVHDWQVQGKTINGFLEVGAGFPIEPRQEVRPGKIAARTEVSIPAISLQGVDLNGKPGGKTMDKNLYELLQEQTSPNILYRLSELVLKTAPETETAGYVFESKGALIVAGVTNQVSIPIQVFPLGNGKLKITGNVSVRMTDFSIRPPTVRLSPGSGASSGQEIKLAHDEVQLRFEWFLEREQTKQGQ
jgi:hypothetical protein